MVAGKLIINNSFPQSLKFIENTDIKINPSKLLKDIKLDFENFITELNENSQSRERFDNMFHNM